MKVLSIVILILFLSVNSFATITWTKDWSSADDGVNSFGGANLEDIQDDIDSQFVTASDNLTFSSDTTFSGTCSFTGTTTISGTNTFSGNVTFSDGFGIEEKSVKVGSFAKDTADASGNQSITGVGFKPKGILIFSMVLGTTQVSWGMSDGTDSRGVYNDDATSDGTYTFSGSMCITASQGGAVYYEGAISSFDSDGFTLSWTKTGAKVGNLTVMYLVFGA